MSKPEDMTDKDLAAGFRDTVEQMKALRTELERRGFEINMQTKVPKITLSKVTTREL